MKELIGAIFVIFVGLGLFEDNVVAQTPGDVAVEVYVYSRTTGKPLENVAVFLYQTTSSGAAAGGFYTDANGFIALEAPLFSNTIENHIEILCVDRRRNKQYRQVSNLYVQLQSDRIYQRNIYLDVPSRLTICDR